MQSTASLTIKCDSFLTHFGYKIPGNNDDQGSKLMPTKDKLTLQNVFHLEFLWLILTKTVHTLPSIYM